MDRSLNPILSSSCIKKLKAIITLILNNLNVYSWCRADNVKRAYPCGGIAKLYPIGVITLIALSFLISFTVVSYANETTSRSNISHSLTPEETAQLESFINKRRNFIGVQDELPKDKIVQKKIVAGNEVTRPINANTVVKILAMLSFVLIIVMVFFMYKSSSWNSSFSNMEAEDEMSNADVTPEATTDRMKKVQKHADELASEGMFAEAMHLLLLQSVGELRNRLNIAIAISLTSREILRTVSLASDGKSFFSDIIARVENSYFGNYIPGQEDYIACRDSYDNFLHVVKNVQSFR